MKFSKKILALSLSSLFVVATGAQANSDLKTSKVSIGKKMATTNIVGVDTATSKNSQNYATGAFSDKKSSYVSSQTKENLDAQYHSSVNVNKAKLDGFKKRAESRFNKGASHLRIYDAAVLLKTDTDGDGYYSEIRVDFDVDATNAAYYDVYAELYIRRQGTVDWTHYFTTDVFEIYYDDNSDDYHVTTTFNDGFPPAQYEIAIDLFEYGYSGRVDHLEASHDPDLGNLPIEDSSQEQIQPNSGVSVSTVKTEIFTDSDGDGFYRDFKISFDADVASGQRSIIAKLYQRTGNGDWQFETESSVYEINGTSTDDTIAFEGNWQSGYATSHYDFKIELYDSATNEFLVSASNDFGPLVDVPLEDAGKDTTAGGSSGGSGSTGSASTSSSGSGGGSWNWFGLFLLSLVGVARRKF